MGNSTQARCTDRRQSESSVDVAIAQTSVTKGTLGSILPFTDQVTVLGHASLTLQANQISHQCQGKRGQGPELKPQDKEGASLASAMSVNHGSVIDLLGLKPTGGPTGGKSLSFCSRQSQPTG
ncbi:Draxin [Manis pentadactyla]|nr:Draxin [Manis pentadactyla]